MVTKKRSLIENVALAILKHPYNAIVYTIAFSLLPFFSFVSSVIVALVSLRRGFKASMYIAAWAILPTLALYAYQGMLLWGICLWGLNYLIIALLANVLRISRSWGWVFAIQTVFVFVALAVMKLFFPNYLVLLQQTAFKALEYWQQNGLQGADVSSLQAYLSEYMLAMQVFLVSLESLATIAMARSIQARLFYPDGYKFEITHFRLHLANISLFFLAFPVLFFSNAYTKACMVVAALPLLFAGLSLLHWRIRRWRSGKWMVLLPCYLFLIAFPFSCLPFVILGAADMWCNFRNFRPRVEVI